MLVLSKCEFFFLLLRKKLAFSYVELQVQEAQKCGEEEEEEEEETSQS